MFMVEVTPGMAWVEIPEAGLRVLCGCPADAVKHLMRRGLIRPVTVKGVVAETGPNAILLSDVMIQGGDFSNLAEFPVLQMFYRQGTLIPGHPNNTGIRPLLIGRREQVDAQTKYIYRGNYGLISEEELIAAGLPQDQAREHMRLKLRFAFGRIQDPRELLEGVVLDSEAVEIRPGVWLKRLALNVFEFTYHGESVTVDINLPPFMRYECPYPLGAFQFRREYFAIVHSGEGDGWDVRRPSMGAIVVFQGRIYLVDAGPNLAHSLSALGIGINEVEGIFHTHSHDDHFAGLTTLMQSDRRIKYFAVPMVRSAVAKKMAALLSFEERDFDHYFDVRDLALDSWNEIGGLDVLPVHSPHPVETTVFHFRAMAEGGYRTYAHFADITGLKVLEDMVTDDADKPGITREYFDRVARAYRVPANVKKVDIGGGMIHGDAVDFTDDASGKIILAHTAQPLSAEQKRIGSGASFGTVDVLISSHSDFPRRAAYEFLKDYFSTVPHDRLGALLNGPVLTFNPETILIKGRQTHRSIYLLLTGLVEVLDESSDFRLQLSAGALLGEMSGLHSVPTAETYRAISFVQVLEIPCDLYGTFVQRHQLFSDINRLMESREFLSRTWLLGGVVATGTLNTIAKDMRLVDVEEGEALNLRDPTVGLLRSGRVVRCLGGEVLETLEAGDFFGEETAVFDAPPIATLRTETRTQIYMISPQLLAGIPNVRWKLFETFERRSRMETTGMGPGGMMMAWHDEFCVNVQTIDTQHRRLFATANTLLDVINSGSGDAEIAAAVEFLFDYAKHHFAEEEALLRRTGYPYADAHAERHASLIATLKELEDELKSGGLAAAALLDFLHGWLVNHVLVEDRKFAAHLNARGVN